MLDLDFGHVPRLDDLLGVAAAHALRGDTRGVRGGRGAAMTLSFMGPFWKLSQTCQKQKEAKALAL